MKLTRAGTGVAPRLHPSGPPKTTLRELQFDDTDRPYDEHFGAGIALYNVERPRSIVYLDQVLTADTVQTNFPPSAPDYTESEAHDLSHAYEQSLPSSVAANIVKDPLTELGSPNHSDLNPNEMAVFSPGNGREMVAAWDGDDPPELNAPNPLETVDISGNSARMGAFPDVTAVAMNITAGGAITFEASGGANNILTNNVSATNTQALNIETGGGTGQGDGLAVNSTAGNQTISAGF